ncbi:uncharacterized protein QC763_0087180 [Podospora pseudopauciseta]|uniref:Cytochrome P450 E-class, group I n=1 Tax=Podospora pseudopauciseta TaxID=2093780 RepID=A0ABR0H9M2_9PEZI|nr:hypothetical protein QC763_0087180 [Podospora pseudopauciseta]
MNQLEVSLGRLAEYRVFSAASTMLEQLSGLMEAAPPLPVVVLACLGVYLSGVSLSRLYLSPLSRFPGPKLAAGPIIRINPWELHASDPVLFSQIYSSGVKHRIEKYAWSQQGLRLIDNSHILTESHELHKLRRKPLATFFSSRNTDNMEPIIWQISQ